MAVKFTGCRKEVFAMVVSNLVLLQAEEIE